jgi:hypothetical protein
LPSNDRGIYRHTDRQQRGLISLLYILKIRKLDYNTTEGNREEGKGIEEENEG